MRGRLLKPEEVADRLNVSKKTVYKWLSAGKLPYVKLSHKVVRVDEEDLEKYIRERRVDRR